MIMISRRAFLKSIGAGTAALTAGYISGSLIQKSEQKNISLYGFVPADSDILEKIISSFIKKFEISSAEIFANAELKNKLKLNLASSFFPQNELYIELKELNHHPECDILLTDAKKLIYNPSTDFDQYFQSIRSSLRNKKADYFLNVNFRKKSLLAFISSEDDKKIIIENNSGIIDEVLLSSNYDSIIVDGNCGKTSIQIKDGFVFVKKSSCKNKLCELHGKISHPGNMIACAPNKLIVRVEKI